MTPDKRLDELWDILRDGLEDPYVRVCHALDVLRATKNDSVWKAVDSYKDVPEGQWLFKTEEERYGVTVHTGSNFGNGCIFGGHFAFDMPRVIAYTELPE